MSGNEEMGEDDGYRAGGRKENASGEAMVAGARRLGEANLTLDISSPSQAGGPGERLVVCDYPRFLSRPGARAKPVWPLVLE